MEPTTPTTIPDLSLDFLGSSEFLILIPKANRHAIAKGSGITAKSLRDNFQIDYEGNLYGACNMKTYEQRLLHAASRGMENYPTVARIWLSKADMLRDFEVVGILDYENLKTELKNRQYYGDDSEVQAVKKSADIFPEQKDKLEAWASTPV
jgi:hypothetical protein